jgi:heme exporter protein A
VSSPTFEPSAQPLSAAPAPVPVAVEANGLCRRYGRRWALIDVSFRVPRGSACMVAGRNGSGKSTLLRVLSTAIRADRGSGSVEGFDLASASDEVRRRVALLSHAAYIYEALSPMENLRLLARFLGRDGGREAIAPLLEEVGLAERADDPVSTFSAGMRKRLALARVLMQEAAVVMLDEPYGQLDPPGFRFVESLFGALRRRGTTVLVATHQLDRGAALCDSGIVLETGRVAWTGRAADLPRHSGLTSSGLAEG